jgi:hypothetical protein
MANVKSECRDDDQAAGKSVSLVGGYLKCEWT